MIRIVILLDNVHRSLFRHNDGPGRILDELPEKLSLRVARVLTILVKRGIVELKYEDCRFILSDNNGNQSSPHQGTGILKDDFISELIEVLSDFDWYLAPHISAHDPNRLGGGTYCNECMKSQRPGRPFINKCDSSFCSSHERWAKIVEEYVPIEDSFSEVSPTLDSALLNTSPENAASHKKLVVDAFRSLPRTGDANEWIQKG